MTRQQIIYWVLLSLFLYLPLALWSTLPLWWVMLLAPAVALLVLFGALMLFRLKTAATPLCTLQSPGTEHIFQNQDFDLSVTPCCPHCSSANVAKMIYGKPTLTRQMIEGLETGKIISAGCMIHGGAPEWHCYSCKRDFGHITFDLSEQVEELSI